MVKLGSNVAKTENAHRPGNSLHPSHERIISTDDTTKASQQVESWSFEMEGHAQNASTDTVNWTNSVYRSRSRRMQFTLMAIN